MIPLRAAHYTKYDLFMHIIINIKQKMSFDQNLMHYGSFTIVNRARNSQNSSFKSFCPLLLNFAFSPDDGVKTETLLTSKGGREVRGRFSLFGCF